MTTEHSWECVVMGKEIDLKDSVYQLCSNYPELIKILEDLGFKDIAKPGMLNTMGRFMTLEKGARMKQISMDSIEKKLFEEGFSIRKE